MRDEFPNEPPGRSPGPTPGETPDRAPGLAEEKRVHPEPMESSDMPPGRSRGPSPGRSREPGSGSSLDLPGAPEGADALRKIFEEHHRLVFNAAYRITGNAMDAEDVLQTVFLRLMRRDAGAHLGEHPARYLHLSAVNGALDLMRQRRSARSSSLDEPDADAPVDPSPDQEERERGRELRTRLREALAKLTPMASQAFVLRYFEGYGNTEIARILGTSRGVIAVVLHRARARVRKEIGPHLQGARRNRAAHAAGTAGVENAAGVENGAGSENGSGREKGATS
jgi:RNA polymerase sigma-70 factor (ECF subfamily)